MMEELVKETTAETRREEIVSNLNPLEQQNFILLQQGMKNSLSEGLKQTLSSDSRSGNIQENSHGIWLWAVGHQKVLGIATEKKAMTSFAKSMWAKSRKDLQGWVAELRGHANDFGPSIPEGEPRESRILDKVYYWRT